MDEISGHDFQCDGNHRACPSHCCKIDGCKYGYKCCPVVRGEIVQEGPCQDCPIPDARPVEDQLRDMIETAKSEGMSAAAEWIYARMTKGDGQL